MFERVRACVRACVREYIRDVMWCATRRRCAGIVNVMLMVLMGSRCHTSGMRIQSHAGVTLLPVYMPRVRTLRPDHLQSVTSVNLTSKPRAVPLYSGPRWFRSSLSSFSPSSLFRYKNHAVSSIEEPCIKRRSVFLTHRAVRNYSEISFLDGIWTKWLLSSSWNEIQMEKIGLTSRKRRPILII